MTLDDIKKEVEEIKRANGAAACTNVHDHGDVYGYVVQPGEPGGYIVQYHLPTGARRHCGLGPGCFWVED